MRVNSILWQVSVQLRHRQCQAVQKPEIKLSVMAVTELPLKSRKCFFVCLFHFVLIFHYDATCIWGNPVYVWTVCVCMCGLCVCMCKNSLGEPILIDFHTETRHQEHLPSKYHPNIHFILSLLKLEVRIFFLPKVSFIIVLFSPLSLTPAT